MKISRAEIEAAMTPAGGFTKATLAAWGVPWPPPKGWRKKLEAGEPPVDPVGWVKCGHIRNRDGIAIGQDEPEFVLGAERPEECDDPWWPVYAAPFPVAPAAISEALVKARKIIAEIDEYQRKPERGHPDHECACCMGELLDDDRGTIAEIDVIVSQIGGA